MSRVDSAVVAVAAGVGAFALTVLAASFLEWPMLTYLPRQHVWRMLSHPPPSAMSFYGLVLWGLVGGVDAAAVAHAIARSLRGRTLSPTAEWVAAGGALVSLLLATGYFALRFWPR